MKVIRRNLWFFRHIALCAIVLLIPICFRFGFSVCFQFGKALKHHKVLDLFLSMADWNRHQYKQPPYSVHWMAVCRATWNVRCIQNIRTCFFLLRIIPVRVYVALISHNSYKCWLLQVSQMQTLAWSVNSKHFYILYKAFHSIPFQPISLVIQLEFF